jgi:arylsulfatase A-like enzyme
MRREAMQAYYACATFIDAQVGVMTDALRRLGLWDNTIVVFTSDHGYHLGEHGMWGKVTLYEECDRIPMIVRAPGRTRPGSVSSRLVELVDLYPTLADLCRLGPPSNLEGTSFVPLMAQPDREWKTAAFSMVKRGKKLGRAIRTERFKYAEYGDEGVNELYDLKADPHEWTNLARDPAYADEVTRMRKLLHAGWRKALPRRE